MLSKQEIAKRREELKAEKQRIKRKRELEDLEMKHKFQELYDLCEHKDSSTYKENDGGTVWCCHSCGKMG